METLIEKLKKETTGLKEQYLKKTEDWVKTYFTTCVAQSTWKDADWCNYYGMTPRIANKGRASEFFTFPSGFHNTKESVKHYKKVHVIRTIASKGLDSLMQRELNNANLHYEDSIIKLASKISDKGLNEEKIIVKDSSVGVNINTTITDGVKTIRAFTIFADGEIQKPHFRYLIK